MYRNQNINLFTLDVEKLYPSIQPQYALEALRDMLSNIDEEVKAEVEGTQAWWEKREKDDIEREEEMKKDE